MEEKKADFAEIRLYPLCQRSVSLWTAGLSACLALKDAGTSKVTKNGGDRKSRQN